VANGNESGTVRAATWATNRDITAARPSWERARKIADALPAEDPARAAMRIAPRTMLCITACRGVPQLVAGYFDELRELCALAGDKASLAIAMTGLSTELTWHGRAREASRLASEQMALLESIGDPTLTIGAAYVPISIKINTGEIADALRWSQTVIDLAGGDPAKGANLAMGSPLAGALAYRGVARYWLGRPGWREDLGDGVVNATTINATAATMSHCSASVIVLSSSTNCNTVVCSTSYRNAVGKWVDLRVCAMTQPPSRIRGSMNAAS
jgi:hypothetical protein